jgi:abhydrolase domain-containing protein 5
MQAGHFVFIDNPSGFHEAVVYACHQYISSGSSEIPPFPERLTAV